MNKYISFYCSGLIVLGVWFLRRIKNPILKSDLDLAETNVETKAEPITNLDNNKVMTKAILHTNKGISQFNFSRNKLRRQWLILPSSLVGIL